MTITSETVARGQLERRKINSHLKIYTNTTYSILYDQINNIRLLRLYLRKMSYCIVLFFFTLSWAQLLLHK